MATAKAAERRTAPARSEPRVSRSRRFNVGLLSNGNPAVLGVGRMKRKRHAHADRGSTHQIAGKKEGLGLGRAQEIAVAEKTIYGFRFDGVGRNKNFANKLGRA